MLDKVPYHNDFRQYYFDGSNVVTAPSPNAVPKNVENFCNIHEAIGHVQKLGCVGGTSQHKIRDEYHRLCLEVLKLAVERYGTVFPIVFRGIRSNRPENEHLILFGSRSLEVAAFYGSIIKKYRNVRGLLTFNYASQSVVSNDYNRIDEEIIFFPS